MEEQKRKTTTSTQVKAKYNAKTYKTYRFNVRYDDELHEKLEEYKDSGNSLNSLFTELAKKHFCL